MTILDYVVSAAGFLAPALFGYWLGWKHCKRDHHREIAAVRAESINVPLVAINGKPLR